MTIYGALQGLQAFGYPYETGTNTCTHCGMEKSQTPSVFINYGDITTGSNNKNSYNASDCNNNEMKAGGNDLLENFVQILLNLLTGNLFNNNFMQQSLFGMNNLGLGQGLNLLGCNLFQQKL